MEHFQPATADVDETREWVVLFSLVPLAAMVLLALWYTQRPLCLILNGTDCPDVREHYALYFAALTPYALTCMLASTLRYSTHEGAVFVTVYLSWFAAMALVAVFLVTAFVPHQDWEDWLWTGVTAVFLVLLFALKAALFNYKKVYKRFLKRARKNIGRTLGSNFKGQDAAKVPIALERHRQGLLRLFYFDLLAVSVYLLTIFVFQILPGSWNIISIHTLFFVLSFSALHFFLVPYRRILVGLKNLRDQIDDTILVPLSVDLIVFIEGAIIADAAFLVVDFVYVFILIVQAPDVDIATYVVAVVLLGVIGAMLTIDVYTIFDTRLLVDNIAKYVDEVIEVYPELGTIKRLTNKPMKTRPRAANQNKKEQ